MGGCIGQAEAQKAGQSLASFLSTERSPVKASWPPSSDHSPDGQSCHFFSVVPCSLLFFSFSSKNTIFKISSWSILYMHTICFHHIPPPFMPLILLKSTLIPTNFVFFLFVILKLTQSSVCAAHTCMGVRPLTGAWLIYQGPQPSSSVVLIHL